MDKNIRRKVRHFRVRKKVIGTSRVPRISVFRSNKNIFAQIIDDESSKTLVAVSSLEADKVKESSKISKIDTANTVGEKLAQLALKKNIKKAVFDRAGYKYHGRIKSLAEGARKGGLKF